MVWPTKAVTFGVPPSRAYNEPAGATAGGGTSAGGACANVGGAKSRRRGEQHCRCQGFARRHVMTPDSSGTGRNYRFHVPRQAVETTHNFTEFRGRFTDNSRTCSQRPGKALRTECDAHRTSGRNRVMNGVSRARSRLSKPRPFPAGRFWRSRSSASRRTFSPAAIDCSPRAASWRSKAAPAVVPCRGP